MGAGRPSAAAVTAQPLAQERIAIECHEDDVPPFVESALQQLYSNLFSSLAHRRIFSPMESASTYVERRGELITCVWLFRREGRRVQVLNEGLRIREDEVARFAEYTFLRYPAVDVISFHAVQAQEVRRLRRPCQRFNCLEDMVLTLPASVDAYRASLGKSTRSYINRYLNKLRRDFPSFRFSVLPAHDIDEQDVRHIIGLNRERMAAKGKATINDEDATQRIVQLAIECGMVCTIVIDGRICAGTVNYCVGNNYFLEVLAHDPAYNDHRLGTLCCYLTICECIARGGNEYHMLWGQDEYKSRLMALQRDLDHLAVYRSHAQMLLNGDKVLGNAVGARVRRARMWLRAARRQGRFAARFSAPLLRWARSIRWPKRWRRW